MISSIPRPCWGQLSYFHFTAEGGAEELVLGSWPSQKKRICGLQLHCFDKLRHKNPFKMPQFMICPLWVWLVMLLIRDFLNASVVYDHVVSNLRRFGGNSKARNVPWNHRMSFASEWVCQSASWLERRILFDSLKWLKNILCKKMMIWPYGRLQRFNSQF